MLLLREHLQVKDRIQDTIRLKAERDKNPDEYPK